MSKTEELDERWVSFAWSSSAGIVKAALWVASISKSSPLLQIKRKGDEAEVVGTNAYVMLRATTSRVKFSDNWKDGQCATIRMRDSWYHKHLRRIYPESLTIATCGSNVTITQTTETHHADPEVYTTRWHFKNCTRDELNLTSFANKLKRDSVGMTVINPHFLRNALKAVKKAYPGSNVSGIILRDHGPNAPIEVMPNELPEGVNELIAYAMPMRT